MSARRQVVIHLVHGTFAPDAPWTQSDSSFQKKLKCRLPELDVQFEAPQWGGQNQHSARLRAATKLREGIRKHATRGIPQVLIGHSHGGNACVLACRDLDGSLGGAVRGVACLSTPFLVVRHQPHAGAFATVSMLAWWTGAWVAAFFLTDDFLVAAAIIFPIVIATMGLLFWAHRNRYPKPEAMSVPESLLPVQTLLIRCPGDEASGILGASLIVDRITILVSEAGDSVGQWVNRHLWTSLSLLLLALFLGSAATLASIALTGSAQPLKWPAIVLVSALLLSLVTLMAAWPLRSLIYWWSYGFDIATRGMFLRVTAEATPPGRWTLHTIHPAHPAPDSSRLVHSELYGNEEAINAIAKWVGDLLADKADQS